MVARLKRMVAVARVEGLQLMRDRASLLLIFLLPVFQILLYGYAISLTPSHVDLAVASSEPALIERRRNAEAASRTSRGSTSHCRRAIRAAAARLSRIGSVARMPFSARSPET